MEKQLERRQEAEPVTYSTRIEQIWGRARADQEKAASLPHVVKFREIPWAQNATTYQKDYCGAGGIPARLSEVPIHTIDVLEQIVFPGGRSGKHRHFMEALFYIMEGEGYEIHDDIKYPWQAGDIMCVPSYCIHQHFNARPDQPARLLFSVPLAYELSGLAFIEQIEMHQAYQLGEGATFLRGTQGEVIGYRNDEGQEIYFSAVDMEFQNMMEAKGASRPVEEPGNTYDRYLKTLEEQTQRRQSVPHVVHGDQLPWEDTPMGRLKYYLSPYQPSPLLLYDAYVQELPPGGRSGKHRHVGEEVHKILDGKGYDIHDETRWDWEAEDIVFVPINTVHQHFNADPQRPARFLVIQPRLYHYMGFGGIEHFEDAPDWDAPANRKA
ncbi:MAG: cupin domain-containing protein [Dehalococcoidia bacterium]